MLLSILAILLTITGGVSVGIAYAHSLYTPTQHPLQKHFSESASSELLQNIESTKSRNFIIGFDDASYADQLLPLLIQNDAFKARTALLTVKMGLLTTLPEDVDGLTNLMTFKILNNRLTSIPSTIGNLPNLRALTISGNPITDLPEEIGNLHGLESLVITKTDLASLPPSIGNLTQITLLDIHDNNLTTLPDELASLTTLTTIYLGGNPLPLEEVQKLRLALPETQIFF